MKLTKRKALYGVLALGALLLCLPQFCYWMVAHSAKGRLFEDVDEIPYNEVGMVLGTGPTSIAGCPNPFFINRVDATDELYKAGKNQVHTHQWRPLAPR